jgi:hypothetical protein
MVIYGINGAEARKIRPDFNALIIDDSTSTLLCGGLTHRADTFKMTSMESMRGEADDRPLPSTT